MDFQDRFTVPPGFTRRVNPGGTFPCPPFFIPDALESPAPVVYSPRCHITPAGIPCCDGRNGRYFGTDCHYGGTPCTSPTNIFLTTPMRRMSRIIPITPSMTPKNRRNLLSQMPLIHLSNLDISNTTSTVL